MLVGGLTAGHLAGQPQPDQAAEHLRQRRRRDGAAEIPRGTLTVPAYLGGRDGWEFWGQLADEFGDGIQVPLLVYGTRLG